MFISEIDLIKLMTINSVNWLIQLRNAAGRKRTGRHTLAAKHLSHVESTEVSEISIGNKHQEHCISPILIVKIHPSQEDLLEKPGEVSRSVFPGSPLIITNEIGSLRGQLKAVCARPTGLISSLFFKQGDIVCLGECGLRPPTIPFMTRSLLKMCLSLFISPVGFIFCVR